jgi:hypothetical protein
MQAMEELNALKQENDKLKSSKLAPQSLQQTPRTVQAHEDQLSRVSPRTVQALEELNNLKKENEKLIASKVAGPPPPSRVIQDVGDRNSRVSPRTVQALEELNALKKENEKLAASKTSAPLPPAVPSRTVQGVADQSSRVSPRTVQALEEMNALKKENENLMASKVATKSAPATKTGGEIEGKMAFDERKLDEDKNVEEEKPNLEAQGSFSFKVDLVESSAADKAKSTVVAKSTEVSPIPVMSSRTIAQIRNDPALIEVKTRTAPAAPTPPSDPAMSGRTMQVLDELEKIKKENELLKASKVAVPAGMSDRTRQVMDELEQVKRENAKLMAVKVDASATQQRRLAYLEQNHAIASKARADEIKKMILTSQELDLAFLVDATGSMQMCINLIKDTVANMAAGIKEQYPECKLRVAFAPYRDYEDTVKDDDEACDFTSSFTGPDSAFVRALSKIRASGGGDDAEDVFTGIARVAGLSWNSVNRILIHIADAPCHGVQFHDGVGDFYPAGDKYGRSIEAQLRLLHDKNISTYYFCHLNTSTRKMLQEFKKGAGGLLTITEEQFANISKIPEKVVTLCRGTIQKTLSVVGHPVANPADMKYVNEVVVTAIPSWSDVPLLTGTHYRHKWYRALDDLLSKINRKMAIDEEHVDHVQVQIAKHPFSSEGAVRWPYYAKVTHPSEAPRFMVVKRFKTALNKDVREVHKRDRYLAQMEVQSVAAQMAEEFNNRTSNFKNVKKVEFTQVTTLEVGSGPTRKFYNMEEVLEGTWIRYSNNGGYVNTLDYAAVLQAFTHWTHERSRGLLMVNDLQGIRQKNEHGESVFRLCDPAIHCTDVMRFTRTNLGLEGFKLFFDTHKCNDVCKHLGLAVGTAGRTISGTHVGKYW